MMMMMTMVAELECDVMMHCGAGNHQVPVIEGSPEKCTRVLASHQSGDHPPESGQHLQRKQFVPPMAPASPDRRIPQYRGNSSDLTFPTSDTFSPDSEAKSLLVENIF